MHIHNADGTVDANETPEIAREMIVAATAFLDSLGSDQRRKAVYQVADSERLNWDYRPVPRAGLPFTEMESYQQRRALALLASGLSRRGNITALNIMSLEKILGTLEGRSGQLLRDPNLYFVTVFGEPSADPTWGWRIEGHHLSVNFLVFDNCRVACNPNFFGANPAQVPGGPLKGFRTLPQEEEAARQLMARLDATQTKLAVVNESAPPDIITQWSPHIRLDDPVGIVFSALNEEQQRTLMKLVRVYLGRIPPQLADERMNAIEKEGTGNIHFAWAGSREPGKPHYYRLHGPSLLVEYDNTQDNANHIHSVWRDLRRDWGDDLLRAHYARSHMGGLH